MRPSNKSRNRNKSTNRRSSNNVGNVVNRVFESAGPEGKVRGTPQQIVEKYESLARDAQLAGDRVAAENFQQHSEHYTRLLNEAQRQMAERQAEHEARQQAENEARMQAQREAQAQNPQASDDSEDRSRPQHERPERPQHQRPERPEQVDVRHQNDPRDEGRDPRDIADSEQPESTLIEEASERAEKAPPKRAPRKRTPKPKAADVVQDQPAAEPQE